MKLMIDQHDIWNAIYNARNNRWHPPTSPNTAPATQNDCHDWSSSHMKRYETLFTMRGTTGGILQHHQILRLPRKMILQNFRNISPKQMKRQFQCATDPRPFREWSEHDPTMIRPWSENETVTPQPASQPRLLFTPTTGILYWKIQHFALRLSFQISPNTAPATKSDTSTSPNTAPATKSDTWTSPNIVHLPRKVTLERHQIMHLPRKLTLERHQIVHLPRKVTLERHQIVTRI